MANQMFVKVHTKLHPGKGKFLSFPSLYMAAITRVDCCRYDDVFLIWLPCHLDGRG